MTGFALLLLLTTQGFYPSPTYRPADPRIQRVVYDSNQVVPLAVGRGFAAVIDLGADQFVESVVVGNNAGWEVTASKRGDNVIVKPLAGAAATNMIVITADRRYVFLIEPSEGSASFVLSFTPADRQPVPLAFATGQPGSRVAGSTLAATDTTFRFRGDKALFPVAMRSDGLRTTITWSKATALPAIFAIDGGREAIVNGRMNGNDYIIEGTAPRFMFRLGDKRATAIRQKSGGRR